jgi:hypothetical protein
MSLLLSLSADQFHSKPMAISSITSPAGVPETVEYENNMSSTVCLSPSSSSSSSSSSAHSSDAVPVRSSTKSGSLSPPVRTFSNYSFSSNCSLSGSPNNVGQTTADIETTNRSDNPVHLVPQPTMIHPPFYNPYHYGGDSTTTDRSNSTAPLSLYERRLRNKTASAKYRAKKNQQQGEMRSMISSLTKENELLLRQLDHIQRENNHLKATCDRLRGKIIAQKMLKQYLVETEQQQQQQQFPVDQQPNCFTRHHPSVVGKTKFYGIANNNNKEKWDDQD